MLAVDVCQSSIDIGRCGTTRSSQSSYSLISLPVNDSTETRCFLVPIRSGNCDRCSQAHVGPIWWRHSWTCAYGPASPCSLAMLISRDINFAVPYFCGRIHHWCILPVLRLLRYNGHAVIDTLGTSDSGKEDESLWTGEMFRWWMYRSNLILGVSARCVRWIIEVIIAVFRLYVLGVWVLFCCIRFSTCYWLFQFVSVILKVPLLCVLTLGRQ